MTAEEMRGSWQSGVMRQLLIQEELHPEKACSNILSTTYSTKSSNFKTDEEGIFLCIPTNVYKDIDITCLPWQPGHGYKIDEMDYMPLEKPSIPGSLKIQSHPSVPMQNANYDDSVDIEQEWQWLMSQQLVESKCSVRPFVQSENDDQGTVNEDFEEIVHDTLEGFSEAEQTVELSKEYESCFKDCSLLRNEKVLASGPLSLGTKSGNLSLKINSEMHSKCEVALSQQRFRNVIMTSRREKIQHEHGASWHTDNRKDLAALSQRTPEFVENYDPPSESSSTYNGSLMSSDFDSGMTVELGFSKSVDETVLASHLHGNKPNFVGNKPFVVSPLAFETPEPRLFQNYSPRVSQPLVTSSYLSSLRTEQHKFGLFDEGRNMDDGEGNISYSVRGGNALGEALCHSQTRAREAEKTASQAVQENKKLQQLLFREASLSLTYRQWVHILEQENRWLWLHIRDHPMVWLEHNCTNPSVALKLQLDKWKLFGEKITYKQMQSLLKGRNRCHRCVPEKSNVVVGYTIGLAFVLGLSLAGAGFMIGWSLSWMLLAY